MKTKFKYSLILVSTLLIGMVVGFLISGRITSTRVDKMKSYYTDMGFDRELINIIRPTPEQRKKIAPILKKHATLNREMMEDFHEGQVELFLELKEELAEYLDDTQINQLDRKLDNRKHRFQNQKNNRKGKGRGRMGNNR